MPALTHDDPSHTVTHPCGLGRWVSTGTSGRELGPSAESPGPGNAPPGAPSCAQVTPTGVVFRVGGHTGIGVRARHMGDVHGHSQQPSPRPEGGATYPVVPFWGQRVCHPGPEPRARGLDGHGVTDARQLATGWKRVCTAQKGESPAQPRPPAAGGRGSPPPVSVPVPV